MNHRNHRRFSCFGLVALGLSLVMVGCGLINELLPTSSSSGEEANSGSQPTSSSQPSGYSPPTPTPYPSPTTGVSAPEIEAPAPGAEVAEVQPTLVVVNARTQDTAPLYYTFELSEDESFATLTDVAQGIPEGKGGRTSWVVSQILSEGTYFWRARAQAGYVKSPYSEVVDFRVVPAATTPTPRGGGEASVFDPLTNGTSVGDVYGGEFTPQGWRVKSRSDFIRYEVQPIASGFVEWENLGLRPANPSADQFMLFGMWDPSRGDYRANPFRVHVQKLDTNHNPPYLRLRWIANGEQHDEGYSFRSWDPEHVYLWRLEWGPNGGGNEVRVFLDGQLIIRRSYGRSYSPNVHWVELGIAERVESIVGTIYANLRIGRQ